MVICKNYKCRLLFAIIKNHSWLLQNTLTHFLLTLKLTRINDGSKSTTLKFTLTCILLSCNCWHQIIPLICNINIFHLKIQKSIKKTLSPHVNSKTYWNPFFHIQHWFQNLDFHVWIGVQWKTLFKILHLPFRSCVEDPMENSSLENTFFVWKLVFFYFCSF